MANKSETQKKLLSLLEATQIISSSMDLNEIVNIFTKELLQIFKFDGILFQLYNKDEEQINHFGYFHNGLEISTEVFPSELQLVGNEKNLVNDLPNLGTFLYKKSLPSVLKRIFDKHPFLNITIENPNNNQTKIVNLDPYITVPILYKDENIMLIYCLTTKRNFKLNDEDLEAIKNFLGTFKAAIKHTETVEILQQDIDHLKETNLEKELQLNSYKDMVDTYENILTVSSQELVEAQSTIKAMQVVEEMSRKELMDVKQSMDSYKEVLSTTKKKAKDSFFKSMYKSFDKWLSNIKLRKYKDKKFIISASLILFTIIMVIILIGYIFSFIGTILDEPVLIDSSFNTRRTKLGINFINQRNRMRKYVQTDSLLLKYPLFGGVPQKNQERNSNDNRNSQENTDDNLRALERQSVEPSVDTLVLKGFGQIPNGWSIILSVNNKDKLMKMGQKYKGYFLRSINPNNNSIIIVKNGTIIKLIKNKPKKLSR